MSDPAKLEACLRALDKSEKALEHDDLASAFKWIGVAFSGLAHIAESKGFIPANRRPRSLPRSSPLGRTRQPR
jgi:hypothetical protein